MVYNWHPTLASIHGFNKLNAQKIGERVEKVREKEGGNFSAEDLVKDGRKTSSPLHKAFEWDDTEAAERFRIQQARVLLGSIVTLNESAIEGEERNQIRRVFVSVSENKERNYTSLTRVLGDAELRVQFLAKALSEFENWKSRYEMYEELAGIFKAAEKVKAAVSKKSKKVA